MKASLLLVLASLSTSLAHAAPDTYRNLIGMTFIEVPGGPHLLSDRAFTLSLALASWFMWYLSSLVFVLFSAV